MLATTGALSEAIFGEVGSWVWNQNTTQQAILFYTL
jgi:hypothetical protein